MKKIDIFSFLTNRSNKKTTTACYRVVFEFRSLGVQEFRSLGVQEFRSLGVQEFRSLGV